MARVVCALVTTDSGIALDSHPLTPHPSPLCARTSAAARAAISWLGCMCAGNNRLGHSPRHEGARGRGEARAPLQPAVCGSCETSRELFDCRRRRCPGTSLPLSLYIFRGGYPFDAGSDLTPNASLKGWAVVTLTEPFWQVDDECSSDDASSANKKSVPPPKTENRGEPGPPLQLDTRATWQVGAG